MRTPPLNLALALVACVPFLSAPLASARMHKGEHVVLLKTSSGEDAGKATFRETKGKLKIDLDLKNLPAGEHAVHLHAKPVCDAPDFKGAGGHFNPDMKQHGMLNTAGHHAGDLPKNIVVGPDHTAKMSFTVDYLSVGTGGANDLLANGGTAIMVHEKADDMKTDPTGNAGNRIACGVLSEPSASAAQ